MTRRSCSGCFFYAGVRHLTLAVLTFAALSLQGCGSGGDSSTTTTTTWKPLVVELPRGVVSVVKDFGADPSGKSDSTAALQRAFDSARTQNITVFVPSGRYLVTDTLLATEPRNGRWQPVVIVGQLPHNPTASRPTFVLPANTTGFTDRSKFRPMISFWTDWCLSPGPDDKRYEGEWCGNDAKASLPPYLFNMVLQGIDFEIGKGNPGAVGVFMMGAQGSTIQDVTVNAAADALAGVAGGNGGGGNFVGVKVVGARFGIDMRKTAGFATIAVITLVNQTCSGLLVGSDTSVHVDSTTTATGVYVEGSPKLAGVLAGIDLPQDKSDACWAPLPMGGWRAPGPFRRLDEVAEEDTLGRRLSRKAAGLQLTDALSLVDSTFKLYGTSRCIHAGGSLYVSEAYFSGCPTIILAGQKAIAYDPGAWAHVSVFALGRQPAESSGNLWAYSTAAIIDDRRYTREVLQMNSEMSGPPAGLQTKHHWGSEAADWQSANAVSALDLGAKGDGITDDWKALQNALDANDVVVLPKGLYRISKPLVMRRPGVALVGVGNTRSFLMPVSQGFDPAEQPVLDMAASGATLKSVTVVAWNHLEKVYALRWSGDGIFRQAFTTREHEATFPPFTEQGMPAAPPEKASADYDRPFVVISGGGAFYDFDLDFGCCFGTVVPPHLPPGTSAGPDIASTEEVILQEPGYRTLLINGSTSGLRFYPHNTEQAFSDAYTEIRWSKNVTMYGAKSEGNYAVLWVRDSDLITVHGYGGNACAFPNSTSYKDGFAKFMPSMFRIQRSTRVTLANVNNIERITDKDHPSLLVSAGDGFDPRTYNVILRQDHDGWCDADKQPENCSVTRVLERPVLWKWDGDSNFQTLVAESPNVSTLVVYA